MKSLTARDLMVPMTLYSHTAVSDDATLSESVVALEEARLNQAKNQYPYHTVLVLDKNKKIVGKLGYLDVIMGLEERYSGLEEIKGISLSGFTDQFIKNQIQRHQLWQDSLDRLCERSIHIRVKDVMHRPVGNEYIKSDGSLAEAIHQMIVYRLDSLFVSNTEDKSDILGVLRLSDIFDRITQQIKSCSR